MFNLRKKDLGYAVATACIIHILGILAWIFIKGEVTIGEYNLAIIILEFVVIAIGFFFIQVEYWGKEVLEC